MMKIKRCVQCGGRDLEEAQVEHTVTVGARRLTGAMAASRCRTCGETYTQAGAVEAVELRAATALLAGECDGATVKFVRQVLGFRAADLAELLDVRADTVSRWETGRIAVGRPETAILVGLVADVIAGKTTTIDRLRALRQPRKLGPRVRLDGPS